MSACPASDDSGDGPTAAPSTTGTWAPTLAFRPRAPSQAPHEVAVVTAKPTPAPGGGVGGESSPAPTGTAEDIEGGGGGSGLSGGAVAGVVVGCVVGAALVGVGAFAMLKRPPWAQACLDRCGDLGGGSGRGGYVGSPLTVSERAYPLV